MVTLTLPYPPLSGNHQYVHRYGRVMTRKEITDFRYQVSVRKITERWCPRRGPVSVTLALYPPDARRRDADNAEKIIFDALVRAGVIDDDSAIRRHTTEWHEPEPGGRVVVTVEEYAPRISSAPCRDGGAAGVENKQ